MENDHPPSGEAAGGEPARTVDLGEKTCVLVGVEQSTAIPAALPRSLDHFDFIEEVGRGGFGVVVRAFDRKLHRVVAVKMATAAGAAHRRFVREARAAAAVRHDNVVHVYAVEDLPAPYLVMEYVAGGSLQHRIDRSGPLPLRDVLRFGADVARGLAAAHAAGLVHRDVKPANVLIEPGDRPRAKLTDFGVALLTADAADIAPAGSVIGTTQYMAPEQARGERVDHRADLFGLGGVLYAMITGRPPVPAADTTALTVREAAPDTPPWLCGVIDRLLTREPAGRFRSAGEVADLLERHFVTPDGSVTVPPEADRPAPRRSRWRLGWSVAVAGLAVVVFAGRPFDATRPAVGTEAEGAEPDAQPAATVAGNPAGAGAAFTNAAGMEFVRVPAGRSALLGGGGIVGTRRIELAYDFYIGKYEVTRAEWRQVMGPAVGAAPDADHARLPINRVSWHDAQAFVRQLNELAPEREWAYRLPLSTEWEYACRNGPGQSAAALGADFYAGDPAVTIGADRANLAAAGRNGPCPVGSYPPNRLGVHDMHGNVFEVLDDAPESDARSRLLAGGFWGDKADAARAAFRGWTKADYRLEGCGVRVVRVPAGRAVTPRRQVEDVGEELRRRNPGFRGTLTPTVTDDRVTGLAVTEAGPVRDITPLASLRDLRTLRIPGGGFADLGPLRGLSLHDLRLDGNAALRDLGPLAGMPLEHLEIWGFQGDDLSPLQGMPLRYLNCGGGTDNRLGLEPLRGMPLEFLCLNLTAASDLSPVRGAPLETLMIDSTQIPDLSAIVGMKLRALSIGGSRVTDLGPARGMPIEFLVCDFVAARDTAVLRTMPKLATINKKPAAEFWRTAAALP